MASQSFIISNWSNGGTGLGVQLIPGLVAGSATAYLVRMTYLPVIGDITVRTDLTVDGSGESAGPDLTEAWEGSPKALTWAYTDDNGVVQSIVIKGPTNPDNALFADEGAEPYLWGIQDFLGLENWNSGAQGRDVTVTLDDGIIDLRATLAPLSVGPISARLVAGLPHNLRATLAPLEVGPISARLEVRASTQLRATLAPLDVGPISARLQSRRPLRATLAPVTIGPLSARLRADRPLRATLAPVTIGPLNVRIRVFRSIPVALQATLAPLDVGPISARLRITDPINLRTTIAPLTAGLLGANLRVSGPLRATLAPTHVGPIAPRLEVVPPDAVDLRATLAPFTVGPLVAGLHLIPPPIDLRATVAPLTAGPVSAELVLGSPPVLLRTALAAMGVGPVSTSLFVRTLPTAPRNLRIVLNAMGVPEATWDGPLELGGGTLQRFALLVSDDNGQTYSEVDPTDLKLDRHHTIRVPALEWYTVDAVPETTPAFPFLLGIRRLIHGQPTVGQAISAPWGLPFTISRLGIAGNPGQPGYGAAFVYNDAKQGMAALVAGGDYQVVADVAFGGTRAWEDVKAAVSLALYERDAFGVDQSAYLDTVVVGDAVVLSYAHDRWVAFEIRSRAKIGRVYTFAVEEVGVDERGGIGEILGNVSVRFSRNNPFTRRLTPTWLNVRVSASVAQQLANIGRNDPLPAAAALVATNAFPPPGPIAADTVTLYRGSLAVTRTYNPITNSWVGLEQIINGNLLVNGTILAHHLAANIISAQHLNADIIRAMHISAGAIGADHLQAGIISAEKMVAGVIPANLTDLGGFLRGDQVQAGSLTMEQMEAGLIPTTFDQLTGLIGQDNLADASIVTDKLAAGAVVAEKLAAQAVDLGGLVVHGKLQAVNIESNVRTARILFSGRTTIARSGRATFTLPQQVQDFDFLMLTLINRPGSADEIYGSLQVRVADLRTSESAWTGRQKIGWQGGITGNDNVSARIWPKTGTALTIRNLDRATSFTVTGIIGFRNPFDTTTTTPGVVLPIGQAPGTPSSVTALRTESTRRLAITFGAPASGGTPTSYEAQYGVGSSPSSWRALGTRTSPGTISLSLASSVSESVFRGRTYSVRVRATNAAGSSGWVTRILAAVNVVPCLPSQPVRTGRTATSLTLSTTPNLGTGCGVPTRYRWRYSTNSIVTDSDPFQESDGPQVTITGLRPNTNYWIDVRAENAAGASGYTADTQTTTAMEPVTPVVTTDTDTIYRLATSTPRAPLGGTGTELHAPSPWSRTRPDATMTQGVYAATRTRTYTNGVFTSATAWGNVTRVEAPLPMDEITTDTDTIWGRGTTAPPAPTGGTSTENHRPNGWFRFEIQPTSTHDVYTATRTRTYTNGVFTSATAWGNVTLVANRTGPVTPDAPGVPRNVSVSASGTGFNVSWQHPSTGGTPATYRIQGLTSSLGLHSTATANYPATSKFLNTGGVATAFVRVRAENAGGNSAWVTKSISTAIVAPGVPTNVSASRSGSTVSVSFGEPTTGGTPTLYRAQYRTGGGKGGFIWYALGTRTTAGTISGSGTNSRFASGARVRAENSGGNSNYVTDTF